MEIMRFIAELVRKSEKDTERERRRRNKIKYILYYIALITEGVLTVMLALGNVVTFSDLSKVGVPWNVKWDLQWLWYFSAAGFMFATIIVWLYYAPVVCDILDKLKDAFRCKEYADLFERYQGWMKQFQFHLKTNVKSSLFKGVYLLIWAVFTLLFEFFFPRTALVVCGFSGILQVAFAILSVSVCVLNFSSYYICIVFVYFIMRLCKLERETKLDYIKQCPSATYGFQVLSRAFDIISLYFLLDSLFCSIAYYSFWQMASKEKYDPGTAAKYWAFLYVTLFVIVLGLASWLFIILGSRVYLNRLHRWWKLRSYQSYKEEYWSGQWQPAVRDRILADIDRLNQDKITMKSWEMLISLLAVVANLVTAASIFGIFPS